MRPSGWRTSVSEHRRLVGGHALARARRVPATLVGALGAGLGRVPLAHRQVDASGRGCRRGVSLSAHGGTGVTSWSSSWGSEDQGVGVPAEQADRARQAGEGAISGPTPVRSAGPGAPRGRATTPPDPEVCAAKRPHDHVARRAAGQLRRPGGWPRSAARPWMPRDSSSPRRTTPGQPSASSPPNGQARAAPRAEGLGCMQLDLHRVSGVLPQVASLGLGEQERGVDGRQHRCGERECREPGSELHHRHREAGVMGPLEREPDPRRWPANALRIQAARATQLRHWGRTSRKKNRSGRSRSAISRTQGDREHCEGEPGGGQDGVAAATAEARHQRGHGARIPNTPPAIPLVTM